LALGLISLLTACEFEEESSGLGVPPAATTVASVDPAPRREPALKSAGDRATRKLFVQALALFHERDFRGAYQLFSNAESRQREILAEGEEFIFGCYFYYGRCREGMYQFEEADRDYAKIAETSAYHPYAVRRRERIGRDSDRDGYSDAWEEIDGTGPDNPLSHP